MGIRTIETVDDLTSLNEGARVEVKQDPPTQWVVKGDRLMRVDDESILLSPNLFTAAVNAKLVVARTESAPYEGDAVALVSALREMAYDSKVIRDLLIAHEAAELETCKIEVTITGTIEYPVAALDSPFTTDETYNGWLRWHRVVTLVRDDVMGCQCDTVTDDEVREYVPAGDGVPFEFTRKCNLH